jgi:aminopeptidase N
MLRFDEGNYLLKEWTYKKPLKELQFQLTHDDVPGRLWALEQLSEFSNDSETLLWLKKAAKDDEFWAVRASAVELIGKRMETKSIDFLKGCVGDSSSKVRVAAIKALGATKDVALRDFYKSTFRNEKSYAVKSEALLAVGKCADKSDIPFLKDAAEQRSYKDVVAKASRQAVQLIKGIEASN